MHLWRGGLDGDGLRGAAGGRGFGLGLLLHGVVIGHAPVGHLGLTLAEKHAPWVSKSWRLGVCVCLCVVVYLWTGVHGRVGECNDAWRRVEGWRKQLLRWRRWWRLARRQ